MAPKESQSEMQSSYKTTKRKEHPSSSTSSNKPNNRGRDPKRVKLQDARSILAQTSDAALSNGELDLQKFLAAREFEIKALDNGMRRAKGALTTRAFQQVPRDMRRRTASHNVKRVPKRLQQRAKREMKEDNTPTVTPNKRKPSSSRGRLRAETARRLGVLAERKMKAKEGARTVAAKMEKKKVVGRTPRVKVGMLSGPPVPKSKFRKRQMHKTWLPTHLYHAKRAKMTEPKYPLWRFAVPLTSTEKSYRPTHRSSGKRGAVCWDMSYMATIGLEGTELALEKVLRGIGITQDEMWEERGLKWREGKRCWNGFLSCGVEGDRTQIGPATVIWSAPESFSPNGTVNEAHARHGDVPETAQKESAEDNTQGKKAKSQTRRLIVRIHPSAFLELWHETLRFARLQRPAVHAEDLRFEIGTIELTGPGSTEALLGILHPFDEPEEVSVETHATTFKRLGGVTNPGSLPPNAILTFPIMDPRLHFPPRKAELPKTEDEKASFALLEMLANWPADQTKISKSFFDRSARQKATQLPSQKALNRRKGLAPPGKFPARLSTDPPIPVLLYSARTGSTPATQQTWTLLAPWKCILPIWYGLMHYPLSTGGNPRFGGLQEMQQIHFEQGKPWFPGDYPGTQSGWAWELDERERRKVEWTRRPKGKRTEFSTLNLGTGRKGEIGLGWACDFEKLLDEQPALSENEAISEEKTLPLPAQLPPVKEDTKRVPNPPPFQHCPGPKFSILMNNLQLQAPPRALVIVRITLFSRGVPLSSARIYRLPTLSPPPSIPLSETQDAPKKITTGPSLREKWLALVPPHLSVKSTTNTKPRTQKPAYNGPSATILGRRALAQELLQTPPLQYPAVLPNIGDLHPPVPGEEDLIGFVTTGNFNLAEGKGTAIGSLVVAKVLDQLVSGDKQLKGKGRESRICIVRNAGETIGRLGLWEVV